MSENYKRRCFFIKKQYQGSYVIANYILVVTVVLLFGGLLAYFTSDAMTMIYSHNDLQLERTPYILFKKVMIVAWLLLIPGGAFLVLRGIRQSHRTAGPLYKFENVFDEMSQGRIGQTIYLRDKDQCKDLAEKINIFNHKLASNNREVSRLAHEIEEATQGELDPAERLVRIKQLSKELGRAADSFTVVNDR
ncbi:MAG: methyl-accepting chemotaxis protein [Desulfobulbaceae bacterium]|nr:methyl-accepting chemotaxis protein [Desulfobulbaceae bacterium]